MVECMLALVEARVEPAAEWAPVQMVEARVEPAAEWAPVQVEARVGPLAEGPVQMEARVGPLVEGQRRRAPWADPARVVRQRPASRR